MKKLFALFTAVIIALSMSSVAATAETTATVHTVSGKPLNVRSSTQTHSNNIIASLPDGSSVTVLSRSGSWCCISFTLPSSNVETRGYVMARYLTGYHNDDPDNSPLMVVEEEEGVEPVKIEAPAGMTAVTPVSAYVRPSNPTGWVRLRTNPDKSSKVLGRYYQNSTLTVLAENDEWCYVYDETTQISGYIMREFLMY